jgi:cysteinyl-tRNA synthetase
MTREDHGHFTESEAGVWFYQMIQKKIYLTNTRTHKKEEFRTLTPGEVKMYSCGPTVYGEIHIGNLRAGLTADLFYRLFKRFGYKVNYVRNYTDIDDKIIKRAKEEGVDMGVITRKYIEAAEKNYALAKMEEPTRKTLVTDHVPEIIAMIESILKNDKGYVTAEGDVYFSIDSFPQYGALSGKTLEDLKAGARVEVNETKRNAGDFALWKRAKPGEPSWDSPWGAGRPGWHIECSAMACKWLGPRMDLHHGGEDLVFPHHENEIAQSEAATGIAPYVGTWVHNAFLTFSSEKMSKSLGNIVNAIDFLSQYGGEVARMAFLSVHYRSPFDFSPETVDSAITSLERIYESKLSAEKLVNQKMTHVDPVAEDDVYFASGRDLQAEEILKEAVRTNPGRLAIHTKLLEIFAKRRDAKGYESAATQAYKLTGSSSPEWSRICETGLTLDPTNPLYQPGGAPDGGPSFAPAAAGAA